MSNMESPAADCDQTTPIPISSETDDPLAGPDPLLGSGSFIDPNPNTTTTTTNINGVGDQIPTKEPENSTNPNSTPEKTLSRPSWLPENWDMKCKKRTSGATEGTIDRYYIAPTGQRLRSKNEVLTFIETGSKRKKPTPNSDDPISEGSAKQPKKKSSAKKKVHAALTFDFQNPPEKVSWRLTYASEDIWSPCIGDRNLPHSTKQEWAVVFNQICQN